MPKFLDAPSWYDENGTLREIQSTLTIMAGTYYSIPSYSATSSSIAAFNSSGQSGAVACSFGLPTFPTWTAVGETGQFLKSNGSNMPTWSYVGFSYYAMRVNYDGNHNNLYNVYDINGNLVTGSGRTGIIVIAGKASNDQGSEEVMVNRLATFGSAASSMHALNLLNIFIAAPQFV